MKEEAYFTANCFPPDLYSQGRTSIFVLNAICYVVPVLLNAKLFLKGSFKLEKSMFRNVLCAEFSTVY